MSKPFEADVIDNFSPALRLLNDRVKKIAGQIKVGVKNDQHANSNLTVAQIGQIHETGAPKRNIPARPFLSSWRHTPFRKKYVVSLKRLLCSWRHTPFRKLVARQMQQT